MTRVFVVSSRKEAFFFLLGVLILFSNVLFNAFGVVDHEHFKGFEFFSEELIIGRIMRNEDKGFFSQQLRLGRYTHPDTGEYLNHHRAFFDRYRSNHFEEYNSQLGLQGVFFGLIDATIKPLISHPKYRLGIARATASALLAVVLAYLLLFFYRELGLVSYFAGLFGSVFSIWIVFFGKNIYWMTGLLYLPLVIGFLYHQYERQTDNADTRFYYLAIGLAIFTKSACGYEYISTLLVSSLIPILFFSIRDQWAIKKLLTRLCWTGSAGLLGFLTALLVHVIQLSVAHGSIADAIQLIGERITVRTHLHVVGADALLRSNISGNVPLNILLTYLRLPAIALPFSLVINCTELLVPTIFFIIFGLIFLRPYIPAYRQLCALATSSLLSIIGALSWHLLAQGHSLNHTHLNAILWCLPFTVIATVTISFVIERTAKQYLVYLKDKTHAQTRPL